MGKPWRNRWCWIKIYKGEKAEGTQPKLDFNRPTKQLRSWTRHLHSWGAAPTGYLKVTDITFQVKPNGTIDDKSRWKRFTKVKTNRVVAQNSTLTVTDKDDDVTRKSFSKVVLVGLKSQVHKSRSSKGDKAEGTAVESGHQKLVSLRIELSTWYTLHEEAAQLVTSK